MGVWRQYLAAFAASMSMMLMGTSYGWTSPVLPRLLSSTSEIPMTEDQSSWVAAFIEVGNLFTPLPFGSLIDHWGRKPCILLTGPLYIISWILVITTRDVYVLYLMRIIQGLAVGIICTTVPIYVGEIAQPDIRGSLSTLTQTVSCSGTLFCYILGPYVSYQTFGYLNLTIPVIFILLFIWMPESPYFLMMKNKEESAAEALVWLYGEDTVTDIKEELKIIKDSVREDMTSKGSWKEMILSRNERKALLILQVAATTKYMSGYIGIISYATKTFTSKEESILSSDQYAILMGFILFLPLFFIAALADKLGRRPLLLISTIGCAVCDILAGVYYYMETETDIKISQYSWLGFIAVAFYCILFSVGLGPLVSTLKAELFTSNTRGKASGITNITETIMCFICIKMYQVIADNVGIYMNFVGFAASCIVGAVVIYFTVPETTGKTFSEIQKEFTKVKQKDDLEMNKRKNGV